MAKQLTQRLTALGRAHDLVRPLPTEARSAALLGDLFSVLLAPYDDLTPLRVGSVLPFRGSVRGKSRNEPRPRDP